MADDQIDAVTIASPIGLHAQHGRTALLAGKHVHFNKTMTTTVAEADEPIGLSRPALQSPRSGFSRRGASTATETYPRVDRRRRHRGVELGYLRQTRSAATTSKRSRSASARRIHRLIRPGTSNVQVVDRSTT